MTTSSPNLREKASQEIGKYIESNDKEVHITTKKRKEKRTLRRPTNKTNNKKNDKNPKRECFQNNDERERFPNLDVKGQKKVYFVTL